MSKRFVIILFVILVGLDFITKFAFTQILERVNNSLSIIGNFFQLTLLHNYGFSFSFGANHPELIRTILGPAALIVCFLLFLYVLFFNHRSKNLSDKYTFLSYLFLAAGGFANAAERLYLGYVTDFFHFTFFGKYSFAVFNVADIWVTSGALILVGVLVVGLFDKDDVEDTSKLATTNDSSQVQSNPTNHSTTSIETATDKSTSTTSQDSSQK